MTVAPAPPSPPPGDVRPGLAFPDLARYGDRVALVTAGGRLTYRDLASRVESLAGRLGPHRRLVLLSGGNDVDTVLAYLAALSAGHPVILVPGTNAEHLRALQATYDPDVVVHSAGGKQIVDSRRPRTAHELHPDLALLLSTSGSTGSPKLVRLSHDNLQSNAAAIADYLAIRDSDCAATTLPLHYCYGLSVVNSHLLRGAAIALTDLSVVDRCFWDFFRASRATSFAGVPYTFELLDRIGFEDMTLPHLRQVTQAGGRLAPERVRRFAALGQRRGWDLFVMYGQTEATARMAYLPPHLAHSHPHAIGVPLPGGSFRLRSTQGPHSDPQHPECPEGVGELVYSGPNVMLGYAETPADLALGRTLAELPTGDLARRTGPGLYEVVGRVNRQAKVFGLRIDLDRVERLLCDSGVRATCAAACDRLVVAVAEDDAVARAQRLAARACGLPSRAIHAVRLPEVPRLPNGKTDYAALEQLPAAPERAIPAASRASSAALRALYADVLSREEVTDASTFVTLGGDSLSYVEMSVRMEELLGHLPPQWHTTPIRELTAAPRRRRGRAVDTSVLLRATAILLILGTHANLLSVQGGAHVLLAVAGFNFARFQLSWPTRAARRRHVLASLARVAVPSMVWISGVSLVVGTYDLANVFFLNGVFGPSVWTPRWQFWFLEALVWTLVAAVAVLAVPAVDRAERRAPFGFALTLLAAGLAVRYLLVGIAAGPTERYTPSVIFWFFALGWAIARASSTRSRWLLTAITLAAVPGFFGEPTRELVIIAGIALLTWTTTVRVPRVLGRVIGVLASSSLYVYLTHWQVYPHLEDHYPLLAVLSSLAVGVTYWLVSSRALAAVARLRRRATSRAAADRAAEWTRSPTATLSSAA